MFQSIQIRNVFMIFLFLFICLIGLPSVFGIKCWVCRSDADPKCSDPFDNTSLPIQECGIEKISHRPGLQATMCRKTRQKINGHWRFIRSCAFLGKPGEGHLDENYCLMRTGTYNVFIETCTCVSKDGCNTSSTLHITTFGVLSLFLTLFCVSKLLTNRTL